MKCSLALLQNYAVHLTLPKDFLDTVIAALKGSVNYQIHT